MFSNCAFFLSIAILVSKSGGWISVISPISNLDLNLSSNVGISFGGLSLEMIICLFASCNALNVWKNSSCVPSFPAINWISSINKTSTFLYLFLNSSFLSFFIEFISSFVNFSEETYTTFGSSCWHIIWCPIACIKCVLPRPTPPYKNKGLYALAGDSATATHAACANLLLLPITKVSKVYLGFKFG